MRKLADALRKLKMTTTILALVMAGIVGSIAVVSGVMYLRLHNEAIVRSQEQQRTNLGVAAMILEPRMSGSIVIWSDQGTMDAFRTWDIPPFYGTEIEAVSQFTKEEATVYGLDLASGALTSKTTSVTVPDGTRVEALELDPKSAAYAAIMAGEQYVGSVDVNGVDYLGALQPIEKMSGELLGALFVGTPMVNVEASANGVLSVILVVGGAATAVLSVVGFVLSRLITRPIPKLAESMGKIAEGDYSVVVPFVGIGNEVGAMARAVEVFRENGRRVIQMTEAEAARTVADRDNRQIMMAELQNAFGEVVDAAVAGDFTRRVATEFPDPELNNLASSVNRLVSTFERGVIEIGDVLGAMANADLTSRMTGDYEGAFARLKSDVNAVAERLSEILAKLRGTSSSLKSATSEILSGASNLSARTTKQASTIEETSAAMAQLEHTVLHNAQRATEASANAARVTRTAEEGGQVMDAATVAMERITQSSSKISNIIGMIDDIAFQTNLLALNASVEAARAGDAGKGFAVVAVEVRRLAQSAAQASNEVKVLIDQSTGEVHSGSKLVGEAAGKLEAMLEAVRVNNSLFESIALDSREQASAIEEVTTAMRSLDEMTQHNAALVEKTNAAIEQTESQATELEQIVQVFRLGTNMPASRDLPIEAARRQPRLAVA